MVTATGLHISRGKGCGTGLALLLAADYLGTSHCPLSFVISNPRLSDLGELICILHPSARFMAIFCGYLRPTPTLLDPSEAMIKFSVSGGPGVVCPAKSKSLADFLRNVSEDVLNPK